MATLKQLWIISLHVLVVVMLFTSNFLQQIDQRWALGWFPQPPFSAHYLEMLAYHQRMESNMEPGSVIFIGDSHTQGLNTATITTNAINYGIGGDTTTGVIHRLLMYQSLASAKAIVLEIGINDLLQQQEYDLSDNYRKILSMLPPQVPLIVCGNFVVDQHYFSEGINTRIHSINADLKAIFVSRANTVFVDINATLADSSGNLKKENHIGDGLHLSGAGNAIWIDALKHALANFAGIGLHI